MPTNQGAHQRAYVSNVELVFGPMTKIVLDAVSQGVPNLAKTTSFRSFAPGTLAPVNQAYFVQEEGEVVAGPLKEAELVKGRTLDSGQVIEFTEDEAKRCKTGGLEANSLTLIAVPRSELLACTRPDGTGYRLRPPTAATATARKAYAATVALVSDAKNPLAYIGHCVLKGSRGFYRLDVWQGQLYMERLIHPAELAAADEIDVEVTKAELTALVSTLSSMVPTEKSFVPADHYYDAGAAIEAVVAEKEKATKKAGGRRKPAAKVDDNVTDLLAKSLEQAKAKRSTRRRAS